MDDSYKESLVGFYPSPPLVECGERSQPGSLPDDTSSRLESHSAPGNFFFVPSSSHGDIYSPPFCGMDTATNYTYVPEVEGSSQFSQSPSLSPIPSPSVSVAVAQFSPSTPGSLLANTYSGDTTTEMNSYFDNRGGLQHPSSSLIHIHEQPYFRPSPERRINAPSGMPYSSLSLVSATEYGVHALERVASLSSLSSSPSSHAFSDNGHQWTPSPFIRCPTSTDIDFNLPDTLSLPTFPPYTAVRRGLQFPGSDAIVYSAGAGSVYSNGTSSTHASSPTSPLSPLTPAELSFPRYAPAAIQISSCDSPVSTFSNAFTSTSITTSQRRPKSSSTHSSRSARGASGYAFVNARYAPGSNPSKRARRKWEEIDRQYNCTFPGCDKSFGTLNHLNMHVRTKVHGPKRLPSEFRALRHRLRKAKEAEKKRNMGLLVNPRQVMSLGHLSPFDMLLFPSAAPGTSVSMPLPVADLQGAPMFPSSFGNIQPFDLSPR